MADAETEAEWAKSKKIDEERMKAARALNEAKPDVNALAYLDPRGSKVRGWSSDRRLVVAKAEKLGTWSAVLAPAGIVLMVISDMASVVASVNKIGLGSAIISGIPGGIGIICLGLAIFFGLIGLVTVLYYRFKEGRKLGVAGWSGMVAILLVVVYWWVRSLLLMM